ncbi:MAG TPA: EAL domain-containing protein [Pseudomonas sp.]|uniref:EAL domain-containing protein n=1 Tax=Pseudomonas sp. TaxID=306 RepID=UPI002ED9CF4D
MSVTECISASNYVNHYLTRQVILARDDSPFGSEIRVQFDANSYLSTDPVWKPSAGQMSEIYSNVLIQTQLTALSLKEQNTNSQKKYLHKRFVGIEQPDLISTVLTEELIRTHETLRNLGQTLVITLTELPLWAASVKNKKKILRNVYLLKDYGVEIAFDGYNLHGEAIEIFTTLNLLNYIRTSVLSLDRSLKSNCNPDLFNQIHDVMVTLTHNNKISFIADRVEHAASHILARALPFDYFQGSHYSPADNL